MSGVSVDSRSNPARRRESNSGPTTTTDSKLDLFSGYLGPNFNNLRGLIFGVVVALALTPMKMKQQILMIVCGLSALSVFAGCGTRFSPTELFKSKPKSESVLQQLSGANTGIRTSSAQDCSMHSNGFHNMVGLDGGTGDQRFLCFDTRWYECAWEGNEPNWEIKVGDLTVVGSFKCQKGNGLWIPTSQATRCDLTFGACPLRPDAAFRVLGDNHNNSSTDPGACVVRASQYYAWCGGGASPVVARFYNGASLVAEAQYPASQPTPTPTPTPTPSPTPGGNCSRGNFTGIHGRPGLSNGDMRFFCFDSEWLECGWEGNDPSWERKVPNLTIVGGHRCQAANALWIPLNQSSRCDVTFGACAAHQIAANTTIGDIYNNSNLVAASCAARAQQYYDWCGAGSAPVTTRFYNGATLVSQTQYPAAAPTNGNCNRNGYTGTHDRVGLQTGDNRFLCFGGDWYDCGWESNDPNWEIKKQINDVVGSYTCTANSWRPTSELNNVTKCQIQTPSCPNYPGVTGPFDDNYENASSDQVRCMARAADFFNWCGTTVPVTARYYRGQTLLKEYTIPNHKVIGTIDGIITEGSERVLYGWACNMVDPRSIAVHLYVGGAAGTGQYVGAVTANVGSEPEVAAACASTGRAYRYRIPLSGFVAEHKGKTIFVHGISNDPVYMNNVLSNSGAFTVPETGGSLVSSVSVGASFAGATLISFRGSFGTEDLNIVPVCNGIPEQPVLFMNKTPGLRTGIIPMDFKARLCQFQVAGQPGLVPAAPVQISGEQPLIAKVTNIGSTPSEAMFEIEGDFSAEIVDLNQIRYFCNSSADRPPSSVAVVNSSFLQVAIPLENSDVSCQFVIPGKDGLRHVGPASPFVMSNMHPPGENPQLDSVQLLSVAGDRVHTLELKGRFGPGSNPVFKCFQPEPIIPGTPPRVPFPDFAPSSMILQTSRTMRLTIPNPTRMQMCRVEVTSRDGRRVQIPAETVFLLYPIDQTPYPQVPRYIFGENEPAALALASKKGRIHAWPYHSFDYTEPGLASNPIEINVINRNDVATSVTVTAYNPDTNQPVGPAQTQTLAPKSSQLFRFTFGNGHPLYYNFVLEADKPVSATLCNGSVSSDGDWAECVQAAGVL